LVTVLAVSRKGSQHGDELTEAGFLSNHAGGVLGGISTGQDIVVSMAIKPTSSIRIPRRSLDVNGDPVMVETFGAMILLSASVLHRLPKRCWHWY
jgi:chorismate synthase